MTMRDRLAREFGWSRPTTYDRRMQAAYDRGKQAARGAVQRMDRTDPSLWVAFGVLGIGAALLVARLMMRRWRTVEAFMVRHVVTIDAKASLLDAARRMRDDNVGVLPIIDNGKLTWIVTDRDLVVRALARGAEAATTRVEDCASTTVVSARPHWSAEEALRVMRECRIGRLPVVDDDHKLVGIVTLSSLALRAPDDDGALETAREVSRRSARAA
jgi:CBS domain-containing protein